MQHRVVNRVADMPEGQRDHEDRASPPRCAAATAGANGRTRTADRLFTNEQVLLEVCGSLCTFRILMPKSTFVNGRSRKVAELHRVADRVTPLTDPARLALDGLVEAQRLTQAKPPQHRCVWCNARHPIGALRPFEGYDFPTGERARVVDRLYRGHPVCRICLAELTAPCSRCGRTGAIHGPPGRPLCGPCAVVAALATWEGGLR